MFVREKRSRDCASFAPLQGVAPLPPTPRLDVGGGATSSVHAASGFSYPSGGYDLAGTRMPGAAPGQPQLPSHYQQQPQPQQMVGGHPQMQHPHSSSSSSSNKCQSLLRTGYARTHSTQVQMELLIAPRLLGCFDGRGARPAGPDVPRRCRMPATSWTQARACSIQGAPRGHAQIQIRNLAPHTTEADGRVRKLCGFHVHNSFTPNAFLF